MQAILNKEPAPSSSSQRPQGGTQVSRKLLLFYLQHWSDTSSINFFIYILLGSKGFSKNAGPFSRTTWYWFTSASNACNERKGNLVI